MGAVFRSAASSVPAKHAVVICLNDGRPCILFKGMFISVAENTGRISRAVPHACKHNALLINTNEYKLSIYEAYGGQDAIRRGQGGTHQRTAISQPPHWPCVAEGILEAALLLVELFTQSK